MLISCSSRVRWSTFCIPSLSCQDIIIWWCFWMSTVTTPREAALDSELLCLCATLGKQKIQSLNTDFVQFQPLEFAEKLVMTLAGGQDYSSTEEAEESPFPLEGWEKLGKICSPLFNRTPPLNLMLGTFNMESMPKPAKLPARRTRKVNDEGKATTPLDVLMLSFLHCDFVRYLTLNN